MSGRQTSGVPGQRPRVTCPVCQRDVALTPVTGVIGRHKDPTRASAGYYCDGAGRLTARDAHRADLRRLAKLVAAYPEQARKMVRRLPPARRP